MGLVVAEAVKAVIAVVARSGDAILAGCDVVISGFS